MVGAWNIKKFLKLKSPANEYLLIWNTLCENGSLTRFSRKSIVSLVSFFMKI